MKALPNQMTAITLAILLGAGATTTQSASRPVAPAQPALSSGGSATASATNRRLSALPPLPTSRQVGRRQQRTANVTIVPGEQTTTEIMGTLTEDLSIMACIVDKKLEQAFPATSAAWASETRLLGEFLQTGYHQATQALYLDGYGALFFTSVQFPLVAPAPPDKQDQQAEDMDPVWRQAQETLFESGGRKAQSADRPAYSSERVASLEAALLEALKHASNIRALSAQDSVTIVVEQATADLGVAVPSGYLVLPGTGGDALLSERPSDCDALGTLVVRARKSDADDFAAGKLTAEQFGQKADTTRSCTYVRRNGQREGRDRYSPYTSYRR